MQFNSYLFVLAFLPITLIGYFFLNHFKQFTLGKVFLLVMSFWFCGAMNYKYLVVLFISIGCNYLALTFLTRCKTKGLRKLIFVLAIIGNLLILGYFKYFNFFVANLNIVLGTSLTLRTILIPLGISFYTFQQLSYVVDVYEEKTKLCGFLDYALFASFFPSLVSGPIILHGSIIPQLNDSDRKSFSYTNMNRGLYLFVLGLAKKVLIANTLGLVVDAAYADISQIGSYIMLLVIIAYALQLYFDFSGYSDMARGIALMLNIEIPINFNSPYKANSPKDFWSRWHMSLTAWLTNYIYFPLGGNRKGNIRTYLNIMIVFLVSGIWHGANFTFIVWGLLWGAVQCLTRIGHSFFEKVPTWLSRTAMFVFSTLTWSIFRSDSLTQVGQVFRKLIDISNPLASSSILSEIWLTEVRFLVRNRTFIDDYVVVFASIIIMALIVVVIKAKNTNEMVLAFRPNWKKVVLISFLLVWCVLSFSSVSTFIYSNF